MLADARLPRLIGGESEQVLSNAVRVCVSATGEIASVPIYLSLSECINRSARFAIIPILGLRSTGTLHRLLLSFSVDWFSSDEV